MKIISCNLNGIRSACKKGLKDFIVSENPDIICFQEVKADLVDIPNDIKNLDGYFLSFNSAGKKGYSGVAVLSKNAPISTNKKLEIDRFDFEGRILELKFVDFTVINLYMPHGGRQKENLNYKLEAYKKIIQKVEKYKSEKLILIGDFNIAHNEIDLARAKQNKNNIMFTADERACIDLLLQTGLIDSFRKLNNEGGHYTWWPYAFDARNRNMGWRIDYAFVSRSIKLKKATIYNEAVFSDHCPIGVEI